MASGEQKKAMMAAVPINAVARRILVLPSHVETYADLDEWKAQHGHKVDSTAVAAFRAAFETHCAEHETMLRTSRDFGRLGNHAVTSPSNARGDRPLSKKQGRLQDTALENNRPPIQRQLVDAFGDPVTVEVPAHDALTSNTATLNKSIGKPYPHDTSSKPSQRYWEPEPATFRNKSHKASGPSSATQESFARQSALIARDSVQTSQIQSHSHTDAQDGSSKPNERVQEKRLRQVYNPSARGRADTDHQRTAGTFASEADVYGAARDENDAKRSAAQAERKAAGTKADQSWVFGREEQENPDMIW